MQRNEAKHPTVAFHLSAYIIEEAGGRFHDNMRHGTRAKTVLPTIEKDVLPLVAFKHVSRSA